MSYTINQGVVTGRLTKDADIRTVPSGKTIAKFSLAVDRSQKTASGDWEKIASFFDVAYFCNPAFADCLRKGTSVAVSFELRQNRWTDKEGNNRQTVELFAHDVLLIGAKKEREEQPADNWPVDIAPLKSDIPF